MVTHTSPTFRRRRLARRVRQLREQAGMTQEKAAADLDMSTSALSRKETGEVGTSVHEIRSMMDLYDRYDPGLLDLAREAKAKGWWRAYGIEDRGYIDLETEACAVREFQMANVPGLLQTADYAHALFAAGAKHRSARWVENQVAARMVRFERFTDDQHPLELKAVVDEAALLRPVGGRAIMTRQLDHLLARTEQPRVFLQVMPTQSGAHCAMDSAFILLSFPEPEDPDVLYVEHIAGSLHSEKPAEVRAGRVAFDSLQEQALNSAASAELINRLRKEL